MSAPGRIARGLVLLTAALAVWLHPQAAEAAAPEHCPGYVEGKDALRAGRHDEALERFRACLERAGDVETVRWQMQLALALTHEQRGDAVRARAWYRRFLDDSVDGTGPSPKWRERRAIAQRSVEGLEQALAATHGILALRSTPSGAAVRVDGEAAGPLEPVTTPAEVYVRAGEHVVEVRLPGREPWTGQREVAAGERVVVDVDLPAPPPPEPVAEVPAPLPEAPEQQVTRDASASTSHRDAWGWSLVGSGAALAAVGGVFTGLAAGDADDIDALAPTLGPEEGARRYDDERESLERNRAVSYALYGLGAATAVTGAVLLLTGDDGTQPETSVGLVPSAGGATATARWSF